MLSGKQNELNIIFIEKPRADAETRLKLRRVLTFYGGVHGNKNQQGDSRLQGDGLFWADGAAADLFAAGGGCGGGAVLCLAGRAGARDAGVGVHRGCGAYGGGWILSVQWVDAGEVSVGMVQDLPSAGWAAVVAQRKLSV